MAAANTDNVRNATPDFATTLANSMASGDTSMTLQSTTGLPTGTGITLTIDATDPVSGAPTPLLEETITGVVSGSTVTSLLRGKDGTSAQAHASGANVVMLITANLWNDWQTAYLTSHNQAGKIYATSPQVLTGINDVNNNQVLGISATSSAVNSLEVTNNATGSAPILSAVGSDTNISMNLVPKGTGNVQAGGNPVWQYLNSATYTGGTITSSGATPTNVVSVGVTIPSGCTAVKITAQLQNLYLQSSVGLGTINTYSGASSGALTTKLGTTTANIGASGQSFGVVIGEIITVLTSPSAGAIYYSVAISASASNAKTDGASGAPALILVECC